MPFLSPSLSPAPGRRDHCGTAQEYSETCPSCSPVQARSRVQLPASQAQTSAGPRMLFKFPPHLLSHHGTSERSPPRSQKQGSQRHRGTVRSPLRQRESSAERSEAAGTKEQRCLHKGKVGFEVLPLLSVPQVNPASEREWQKPSCPTAGFQHPKTWGIS